MGILSGLLRFLPGGGILTTILKMPTWVWIVLGALAYTAYIRHDARQSERALCNAEALTAEVQELRRQREATQAVARMANDQAELTLIENTELEQRIKDYESQLADNPSCRLSGDDLGRLPTRQ